MATRSYNPSVRVGNWNEDIQLEEDTVKDFLERRERGELLLQRSADYAAIVLKEAKRTTVTDGCIHFGDAVQLVNPAAKDRNKYSVNTNPRDESVLSVNISPMQLIDRGRISGTCGVTSAPGTLDPVARNVFHIVSTEDEPGAKRRLTFGEPFHIRTTDDGGRLFLSSDTIAFQRAAKKSRHQEVILVEQPSFLTQWRIVALNPQLRLETEGLPVPANERVIITHCKTGQALCVEENFSVRTMLGVEYEVTACTNLDSHKAEKEVNHWILKTSN